MTDRDALRDALADLHRWEVTRGWAAFNDILARLDDAAAALAGSGPAAGLRETAEWPCQKYNPPHDCGEITGNAPLPCGPCTARAALASQLAASPTATGEDK